ncbi:fimbrial biogenesis chaperone [Pseudomonas panipatensis]|uniref:fimbrial biogenesis chaperone n=1 Tax=Pseudomonas panipatensis TaxID=428992 RepID=UPI0035AF2696
MKRLIAGMLLVGMLVLCMPGAWASVVLGGTRVVYPANEREVTLQVENAERVPRLVQAWVDRGDPQSRPDNADAPFLLTPPIVRMEAGKSIALRLMFTHQESLPQDRESLFWLNVMDVPPQPREGEESYLQLAYRSRLKLFYRPAGLPGSAPQAAESVVWSLVTDGHGGYLLRGRNASAYHVSLNSLELRDGGRSVGNEGGMIAPAASHDFPLPGLNAAPSASAKVRYQWIDDFGALHEHEASLGR